MTEAKERYFMPLWGVKIFDESVLTKSGREKLKDCQGVLVISNTDYNKLRNIIPEERYES